MKKPIGNLFREARCADLDQILSLDYLFFPQPWKKEDWVAALGVENEYCCFVLSRENQIIGFSLFTKVEKLGHLIKILVASNDRGQGYAEVLFQKSIEVLDLLEVFLEVSVNNSAAIGLYRKLGFEELVLKKKFYSDGTDAYAMLLRL